MVAKTDWVMLYFDSVKEKQTFMDQLSDGWGENEVDLTQESPKVEFDDAHVWSVKLLDLPLHLQSDYTHRGIFGDMKKEEYWSRGDAVTRIFDLEAMNPDVHYQIKEDYLDD